MRILLDSNILIAGILSPLGPPGKLVQAWLQGRFELVTSHEQLDELDRVLRYPRLRERIDAGQARMILENMDALALLVTELPDIQASPDPADNLILATAVAGKAEFLVSGDKLGMLNLVEIEGIQILTARAAMLRLGLETR